MKMLITAFFVMASGAYASEVKQTAYVKDYYETRNEVQTNYERVCRNVTYKEGSAGVDALTGMIIGGLIGKGITGKDDGAAAGAIIGGVIGADSSKQELKTRRVCENVPIETIVQKTYYSYSTIRFWHNNQWNTLRFVK